MPYQTKTIGKYQEKLIHAFISSGVDYCNGLLTSLPKKTIKQLQLIQNAAASVLTKTRRTEHIISVLKSSDWLPVSYRTHFKVPLLVYKSLNGLGPEHISDIFKEYKPEYKLRSQTERHRRSFVPAAIKL